MTDSPKYGDGAKAEFLVNPELAGQMDELVQRYKTKVDADGDHIEQVELVHGNHGLYVMDVSFGYVMQPTEDDPTAMKPGMVVRGVNGADVNNDQTTALVFWDEAQMLRTIPDMLHAVSVGSSREKAKTVKLMRAVAEAVTTLADSMENGTPHNHDS